MGRKLSGFFDAIVAARRLTKIVVSECIMDSEDAFLERLGEALIARRTAFLKDVENGVKYVAVVLTKLSGFLVFTKLIAPIS